MFSLSTSRFKLEELNNPVHLFWTLYRQALAFTALKTQNNYSYQPYACCSVFTVSLLMAGNLLNQTKNPQITSFSILYIEGQVAQIWISFQKDRKILMENDNFRKALQSMSTRSWTGLKWQHPWFSQQSNLVMMLLTLDIVFLLPLWSQWLGMLNYSLHFSEWGGISVIWTVCFCNRNQTNDALTGKILFYLNARWQLIRGNLTAWDRKLQVQLETLIVSAVSLNDTLPFQRSNNRD